MNDQEIILEFSKRERTVTIIFAIAFGIVGLYIVVNYLTTIYFNPAFPFLISCGLMIYGTYKYYRCPNCNHVPKALGQAGVQMSPESCGDCGKKLR